MSKKTKWNSPIIEVPNEFNYVTKKGNVISSKPLTKKGNIASKETKKSIIIKINNDIDHIKISNQGEKIEKVKKERKPRAKTTPKEKKPKVISSRAAKKLLKNWNVV